MEKQIFRVTFLSDVVLPATSNTEGKIEPLDFISGSTFLGMVAKKEYGEFEDDFAVFHSGEVRFGDATLLQGETPTYKIPLCFFYEKLDDTIVINQLHQSLRTLTQAKQHRKGYISKDFKMSLVNYNYAQKSGYDKKRRRSRDSSMYGYSSIARGTTWQFALSYEESVSSNDIDRIINALVGRQRLGKSKSSQYGKIKIEHIAMESEALAPNSRSLENKTILYLKSRVALIDREGNPTYQLKYLVDGLSDEQIDWSRTQLRTTTYNRYDGSRKTKDSQRVVICSGSIIVLQNIDQEIVKRIKKGVGIYLSEGFGEVLIDPSFLMTKEFKLTSYREQKKSISTAMSDDMVKFLFVREEEKRKALRVAMEVDDFIKTNQNIYSKAMNAQWGTIRSLCVTSSDDLIANAIRAYISKGVAKDKWEGKKSQRLLEAIERNSNPLAFTKLLSMEMPKLKEKRDD